MAFIACPECGKQVSDRAADCGYCGEALGGMGAAPSGGGGGGLFHSLILAPMSTVRTGPPRPKVLNALSLLVLLVAAVPYAWSLLRLCILGFYGSAVFGTILVLVVAATVGFFQVSCYFVAARIFYKAPTKPGSYLVYAVGLLPRWGLAALGFFP